MNLIDATVPVDSSVSASPRRTPFSLQPIKPPLQMVGADGASPRLMLRKSKS